MLAEAATDVLGPFAAFMVAVFAALAAVVGFFKILRELTKLRLENEVLRNKVEELNKVIVVPKAADLEDAIKLQNLLKRPPKELIQVGSSIILPIFLLAFVSTGLLISSRSISSRLEAETVNLKAALEESRRDVEDLRTATASQVASIRHDLEEARRKRQIVVSPVGELKYELGAVPGDVELSSAPDVRVRVNLRVVSDGAKIWLDVWSTIFVGEQTENREFRYLIYELPPNESVLRPWDVERFTSYEWANGKWTSEGEGRRIVREIRILGEREARPGIMIQLEPFEITVKLQE